MTDAPTPREVLVARHFKGQTWDSGNPEAVDGWVTWCKRCGQRPWPCDVAQLAALTRREPLDVERLARAMHTTRDDASHVAAEYARLEAAE